MAVTLNVFAKAIASLMNKEIDWDTDTIKVALFTAAHAPDKAADQYYDAAHGMVEASGTNYSAGGITLTNKTANLAAGVYNFGADNANFGSNLSITARYALIYDASPGSNKPLIAYVDFGEDKTASDGVFNIAWDSGKIFGFNVGT